MKFGSYVPFTIFYLALLLGLVEKYYLEYVHLGRLFPPKGEEESNKVAAAEIENK